MAVSVWEKGRKWEGREMRFIIPMMMEENPEKTSLASYLPGVKINLVPNSGILLLVNCQVLLLYPRGL